MTSSNTTSRTVRRSVADRIVRATTRSAVAIVRAALASSNRTSGPAPVPPLPPYSEIAVIDDPEGRVRLIGVRGTFDTRLLAELAAAFDAGLHDLVHVDFSAAEIAPDHAIDGLEATFDRAEQRGYRLRVVGLDPEHPALLRRTSR